MITCLTTQASSLYATELSKTKRAIAKTVTKQEDRVITGKVRDYDDGSPLYGVSVKVKGRPQVGAVTNADGEFTLKVRPTDKELTLTYIGYITKDLALSAIVKYEVTLNKDSKQLDEVVIAFGTSSKSELTNSVSKISAKDIEQRPITNLGSAITGAAPGVQTTSGGGQPGDGPSIRIRGFGSVTNDGEPLYVVDGAPYEGVLSNINPDDIESITILKDASSTALYGSRAANGVVLVTTKKGGTVKGADVITVRLASALSTRALPRYDILDAYGFYPLIWETVRNTYPTDGYDPDPMGTAGRYATENVVKWIGWNPFNVPDDQVVYADGTMNPNARLLYPDDTGFTDDLSRIGLRKEGGMTYSAANQKSDQYFSLNYLDEDGYMMGSDFNRLTTRLRVNTTPTKWLKAGLNITGNFTNTNVPNTSSGLNINPFYVDMILAPIYPVYKHDPVTGAYLLDENGKRIFDKGDYKPLFTGRNVVYEATKNINNSKRNSFTVVNTLEAKITKSLKFTSNFSAYMNNYRGLTYETSEIGESVGIGKTYRLNSTQYYLNWSKLFNWSKRFGKTRVSLMAGHENYYNYWDQITGDGTSEAIPGLSLLENMIITVGKSSDRLYTTEGYLSKADISYDGKYILSGSFRRDGSSRFNEKNRWGNFWSVSAAYNISKEEFFKVGWIDELKLRGSYGIVGNDRTGNYFTSRRLYNLGFNYGYDGGAALSQVGNPDLKWERNTSTDVAVELHSFKGRFRATAEIFRKQTSNLLFDVSLPLTSGLNTVDENFGVMRNQGIELELGGMPIKTKNFIWDVSVNATKFSNKILSLPASYEKRINGLFRYETGKSIYEYFFRGFLGVNPENGSGMYTPTVDGENRRNFGNPIPDWYGGVNNVFTYKNLSLRVMTTYQIGGQMYDEDYQRLTNLGVPGRALHVDMVTRWQKPGDITTINKLIENGGSVASSRMLLKASYLNIKVAALTYNFDKKLAKRIGMSNAKAYLNGENLLITTARKGADPTRSYTGIAGYHYAPARIISLGLNLTL